MGKTSRNISKGSTNAFDWGCWACCAVRILIASPPSCQPCAMHVIRDINWSVCTSPFLTFPTLNLTIRYIMKILPYCTLPYTSGLFSLGSIPYVSIKLNIKKYL